ncbi:hypothetical protein EDB85DRAFT_2157745 [Lactarius pseudohatsudake]|nr:hypothetical protein EDB85DRAFT_2157745 [Lactarius pseudohatsudake]
MEDGLTSWALAQSFPPCAAALSARPVPTRRPDMARKAPPRHPNTTHKTPQPPTHPTANLPPRYLNTTPLSPTRLHATSTQTHDPVTAHPPRRPNTARKTPPSPTRPHPTSTRTQDPVTTPATPPQHGAQDPTSPTVLTHHPDTDARPCHRRAMPPNTACNYVN